MGIGVLSEDYILKTTGKQRLHDVKKLNLSGRKLKELDGRVLEKMENLADLDLSNNELTSFPADVCLPQLQKLNVAENLLEDIKFIQHFPQLRELQMDLNHMDTQHMYIAVVLCPSLQQIDGDPVGPLQIFVQGFKNKVQPEVEGVWKALYEDTYSSGIPPAEHDDLLENFTKSILRTTSHSTSMVQYKHFMVERMAGELLKSVTESSYEPAAKRRRIEKTFFGDDSPKLITPNKNKHTPSHRQNTPSQTKNTPSQTKNTPSQARNTPSSAKVTPRGTPSGKQVNKNTPKTPKGKTPKSTEKEVRHEEAANFTKLRDRTAALLPSIEDYEPVHFIRCHFDEASQKNKGCSPKDCNTKVWRCAFEPSITDPGQHTSIVATCGGNVVCLIDCKTGHIMKRFKQTGEEFYTLGWTTLEIEGESRKRKANILIAAGNNLHVKLIYPEQNVCYAEFTAQTTGARPYAISCMLVHPQHPSWVFFGMSDNTVTLWDICVPQGATHLVHPKIPLLQKYDSIGGGVLNLVFCERTSHLVGGCEPGLFAWKVKYTGKESNKEFVEQAMELVLPDADGNWDDEATIDGLVQLGVDLVASTTDTMTGSICIWELSKNLTSKGKMVQDVRQVRVTPLFVLEWFKTQVSYINPGFDAGLLACGDTEGSIWLYNIEKLLKAKPNNSKQILKPSRILEWPICDISSKRDVEKMMTDLQEKAKEIVVNCVTPSSNQKYVVAVTDNNLVCIWKKSL